MGSRPKPDIVAAAITVAARAALDRSGVPDCKIAERLGVTRQAVSFIRTGRQVPNGPALRRLLAACEVPDPDGVVAYIASLSTEVRPDLRALPARTAARKERRERIPKPPPPPKPDRPCPTPGCDGVIPPKRHRATMCDPCRWAAARGVQGG